MRLMLPANLVGMINADSSLSVSPFKRWTTFTEFTWLSSLTVGWEDHPFPDEQRVISVPSFQDDAG